MSPDSLAGRGRAMEDRPPGDVPQDVGDTRAMATTLRGAGIHQCNLHS
jgi:hypothetical protein